MAGLIKRGDVYYATFTEGGRERRRSLKTTSPQIAKARKRKLEEQLASGSGDGLPTRTPIGQVVAAYVEHMKAHRPERSWRKDLTHLREAFGECCPTLELDTERAKKCRDRRHPEDRRRKLHPLGASCFEEISTAQISDFIAERVRAFGLKPVTANRYREVIAKVFAWAIKNEIVRMPSDRNPGARVQRYRVPAPEIRYLTLPQIEEQLDALRLNPRLHVMVATLIYTGLRREELIWLQENDLTHQTTQAPNGLLRVRAKTVGGESWQPKTARNRVVPVSSDLRRYLDAWNVPASDEGWLFPSPRGTRWDVDNFSATLRKGNTAAGLSWTCLDYRHSFGSQLAQRGVSLFQISALMGNSPEICRRHYAALVPEAMCSAVDF